MESRRSPTSEALKIKQQGNLKKLRSTLEKLIKDGEHIRELQNELLLMRQSKVYPYFLWHLWFSDVFDDGGFDIVIGNPPYVQLQSMKKQADLLQGVGYETFSRTGDLYCLFYEMGFRLLRVSGVLTYITSNKWMRAAYGELLRNYFLKDTNPLLLLDFGGYQVFETATVDTNILISQKAAYDGKIKTCVLNKSLGSLTNMSDFIRQSVTIQRGFKQDSGWAILSPLEGAIKSKIEAVGTPLKDWEINIYRGILTGFNDAFIIDQKTKDTLIKASPKNDEIIRPIIRGRSIEKYYNSLNNSYLIFTRRGVNIDEYLPVKNHLVSFYDDLLPKNNKEQRGRKPGTYQWYEIQDNIAYWKEFAKPKIVWKRVGSVIRFSYDETGMYCLDSTCFAVGSDLKYIIGYLNSTLSKRELLRNSPQTGTGDVITSVQALQPHLIPIANSDQKESIVKLVDKCIDKLKHNESADISTYEKQIDDIIADVIQLTLEEKSYLGFSSNN